MQGHPVYPDFIVYLFGANLSPRQHLQVHKLIINDMSEYYDLAVLKETAGGDEDFVKQLIQIFIDSAPDDFEKLIDLYESGNIEETGKVAHKMKSSARSMGVYLWEDLFLIEQIGKGNKPEEELQSAVEKLKNDFPKVLEAIKKEL